MRRTDEELDLGTYARAALIATAVEVPILYAGGLPRIEIAYAVGMSLSGSLGICMAVELWLHFWD